MIVVGLGFLSFLALAFGTFSLRDFAHLKVFSGGFLGLLALGNAVALLLLAPPTRPALCAIVIGGFCGLAFTRRFENI